MWGHQLPVCTSPGVVLLTKGSVKGRLGEQGVGGCPPDRNLMLESLVLKDYYNSNI